MANRPLYLSKGETLQPVKVQEIDFVFYNGFSITQKRRSIDSLHQAAHSKKTELGFNQILEISSKSLQPLGVSLSAFNLQLNVAENVNSVETFFQGSKVFEAGGPFTHLYLQTAREAKKYPELKSSGAIIHFDLYGQIWPLNPTTLFYDWLYLKALSQDTQLADEIMQFDAFTDIEFNPKKSLNSQAYSAALFVSLTKKGILADVLESVDAYQAFSLSNN